MWTSSFQLGSPWYHMDTSNMGHLLNSLANLIEQDWTYLAALDTLDNSKFCVIYLVDLDMVLKSFHYYPGWDDNYHGKTISMGGDFFSYIHHESIRVCR